MVYTLDMERYEMIKEIVYSSYAKIFNETIRIEAIAHTSQVDAFSTCLAIKRKLDLETCKIIALLHDYAQFTQNCSHAIHARMGAQFAFELLNECQCFSKEEIETICDAINKHSLKNQKDTAFCECIKDADLMARFFANPHLDFDDRKKQRLQNVCAELELTIPL